MTQATQTETEPITNAPDCPLCKSPDTTRLPNRVIFRIGGDEFRCRQCEDTFRVEELPGWANQGLYPYSMVEREQWMNWYYKVVEGRRNKIPGTLKSDVGVVSKWSKQENWRAFDDSLRYLDKVPDFEGVTYILSEDDPFVVFDGDDLRDPETGELHSDFEKLIVKSESYTDISTSGEGAHVIVRGEIPTNDLSIPLRDSQGFESAKVEVFDRSRHIVMTGEHVKGTPTTIEDGQEVIDDLFERWGETQDTEDSESDESEPETVSIPGGYEGGDAPDDRPECYHAALRAREEHEGRQAFQTNTYAGLLGLWLDYSIEVILAHLEKYEPPYDFDESKSRYHLERLDEKGLMRPSVYTLAQGGILSEPECDCSLHETKGGDRGTTKDIPDRKKMKPAQALPLGSNPPTRKNSLEVEKAPDFSSPTLDRVTDAGRDLGLASLDQILNHNRVDRGRTQVWKVLDALSDAGGVYHLKDGRYKYWCFGRGYVNEGRIEEIGRQQDREINFEWSDLKSIEEIERAE